MIVYLPKRLHLRLKFTLKGSFFTAVVLSFILLMIFSKPCLSQDITDYKFGKIGVSDFTPPVIRFDSGMNAVIISDIGSTHFDGNNQYLTMVFTRYIRVQILNKNGFDIGEREIVLYHPHGSDREQLSAIRGSTFNLENGNIETTKLEDKLVFSQKYSDEIDVVKFSMPGLKEGSVFDLEYTIRSPYFFALRPWRFQGKYPCLWSEYVATIPPVLNYVFQGKGDQNFEIRTTNEVFKTYTIRDDGSEFGSIRGVEYKISEPSSSKRWVKKNIPALHEEPFTTTLDNYYSSVSFQLHYMQWSTESPIHYRFSGWNQTIKQLSESEQFGLELAKSNNWMNDELKNITRDATTDEEKTKRIFSYIQNLFKNNGSNPSSKYSIFLKRTLKEVFINKDGNVAEINLLLTAMLKKANIEAIPVILSTRGNGFATSFYPLINEYNYVVCVAYPEGKKVLLDASDPYNGYGDLPEHCYNGWGRMISEDKPYAIEFNADSIWEKRRTRVTIYSEENGNLQGQVSTKMGKADSRSIRSTIGNSSIKKFEENISKAEGPEIFIDSVTIDSLAQNSYPLIVNYNVHFKSQDAGIMYFNPVIGDNIKTNPFNVPERHYPVEMPDKIDQTYTLYMEIPHGYKVDELPKSARVVFNENEGLFEYLIQKDESSIQMQVSLSLKKANFPVEDYETLREFYAFVVKKENEQIVFRKIK